MCLGGVVREVAQLSVKNDLGTQRDLIGWSERVILLTSVAVALSAGVAAFFLASRMDPQLSGPQGVALGAVPLKRRPVGSPDPSLRPVPSVVDLVASALCSIFPLSARMRGAISALVRAKRTLRATRPTTATAVSSRWTSAHSGAGESLPE